ncbi:hypothetical protein GGR57DRAFT_464522 [Xylariaceae sp. FL1272]|nr:hypothetical protein GGR57DRAFT_464522 [Xylariaceae sp. FL1272]
MPVARGPGGKEVQVHEIERTQEWTDFIQKLTAFHEKRGTPFEPEPRLPTMHGHVNVDLLQLYKTVIEHGGYDEVSKVQKAWSDLAAELGMYYTDNKGMGQLAFQLKTFFYRFLGAYWIQDQYGREPPPKEILESQTAASKHGPLLTRSLDTFKLPAKPSAVDTPTPSERPVDNTSTPASANRASGRLREAPPQRVPFQPETGPSRQSRQASSQHSTPSAGNTTSQMSNHSAPPQQNHHLSQPYNPNNPLHVVQAQQAALRGVSSSFTPGNPETASRLSDPFEPRPPITVPLRPVNTPGNNPVEFGKRQRQLKLQASGLRDAPAAARPVLPAAGFDGPNIYTRCLQALRSGIPAEQAFALNHLVKISFERGDKYKFESFVGLAEGLVDKALEVGNLFYDVNWEVSYDGEETPNPNILDGVHGTRDILQRVNQLTRKTVLENIMPAEFSDKLLRITEAVLTLRNMVILHDNAVYMGDFYPLRDLLCIILSLPYYEMLVEIKHFALDIAEQITPFITLNSGDPLYQILLAQLHSTDRGTILTALRAISRISTHLEATNKLQDVEPPVLQNIMNWLLLNDEELIDACLDFLYQYTAVVANVENLLKAVNMENVVPHLVRLLAHGAKRTKEERILEPEKKTPCSEDVCPLPLDLREKLSNTDQPQRCFNWLQSLFEEDADSHITQIAIWQAYQSSFNGPPGSVRNTLSAADFIRNVSHVFANARAQIIRGPGEVQRFIIEGIRARTAPIDYETKEEYSKCQWQVANPPFAIARQCNQFFLTGEQMWRHILTSHLKVTMGENGTVSNAGVVTGCEWLNCTKYRTPTDLKLADLCSHIKVHIPKRRSEQEAYEAMARKQRKTFITPAKTMSITWEQTMTTRDERNPKVEQPAGIPLSAVLVLRNIARNVVKTESEEELLKRHEMGGEAGGWNERLFRPVMARLFEVLTENKAMAPYVTSLLQLIEPQDD